MFPRFSRFMAKLARRKGLKEEFEFFRNQASPDSNEKKQPTIEDVLMFGNRQQRRQALKMLRKMSKINPKTNGNK